MESFATASSFNGPEGSPLASIGWIADALSGLHFFWPALRGTLRNAWKMFKSWFRIEAPQRAPPMTLVIAQAVVEVGDLAFATVLLSGSIACFAQVSS